MIPLSMILVVLSVKIVKREKFEFHQMRVPSKYVWCMGFERDSDIHPNGYKKSLSKYIDPSKVKKGDIIWVESKKLPEFYRNFFPKINVPFVLVLTHGDEAFPSSFESQMDIESFLSSSKLAHIFSQNCDYKGSSTKVSPLPIGLDLHSMEKNKDGYFGEKRKSSKRQEFRLDRMIFNAKPTHSRIPKAYVDFQLNDRMKNSSLMKSIFHENKTEIFDQIALSGVIDAALKKQPRKALWGKKLNYAFSICPPGNGYDTHRLWEDLLLGCIVIVKTSPLDPLYEGLPVVIIKDWSEVNATNFSIWIQQYGDAFTNPKYREKLYHTHWMNKIKAESARVKELL